jgi:hypothetical protein
VFIGLQSCTSVCAYRWQSLGVNIATSLAQPMDGRSPIQVCAGPFVCCLESRLSVQSLQRTHCAPVQRRFLTGRHRTLCSLAIADSMDRIRRKIQSDWRDVADEVMWLPSLQAAKIGVTHLAPFRRSPHANRSSGVDIS